MPNCAVVGCQNRHDKKSGSVTFHRFPTDEEARYNWLECCGRCLNMDSSKLRICSAHFAEDDFERDLQGELMGLPLKRRLKKGVMPHLNLIKIKEEPIDYEDCDEPIAASGLDFYATAAHSSGSGSSQELQSSDFDATLYNENDDKSEKCISVEQMQVLETTMEVSQIPTHSANTRAPSSLPASQNWPGQYGFNVSFGPQEKNTKGVSWTYSKMKDKLYVGKDASCPINFSANAVLPNDVTIRAMALYSSPEQISDVVHRCVNHSMEELIKGVFEAEHLIRCESSAASYQVDPATKRHSVIVPFENPPAGQQFSTYIYKFSCFGSCAGGPNRRPLMVVFTLEKDNQEIGRRKLDVKICACPGRDRKSEETQLAVKEAPSSMKRKEPAEFVQLSDTLEFTRSVAYPPAKKSKVVPNKDGKFTLTVENLECYEFLKQMKKFYEICKVMKNLPPDIKRALIHIQRKKEEEENS